MESKAPPLKTIPTTRSWAKDFREVMNEKLTELEQKTWIDWARWYDDKAGLPFQLFGWKGFEAWFKTDGELFECVYWMLRGLEFKSSILRELMR